MSESLHQQTATADVLKVISRSTFDLQAVLDTLVESAAKLCQADLAGINRILGSTFQWVANYGHSSDEWQFVTSHPIEVGRETPSGRAILEGRPIHTRDAFADPEIGLDTLEKAKFVGARTALAVPLLREGTPIGVIAVLRRRVQPFTDREIELVTTFADQAVIAIENARLFDEVQARTKELTKSLEQQTATSEVLHVISSSPGELKPVFDAMLGNAVRICEAQFGLMFRFEGGLVQAVASLNIPPPLEEFVRASGRHSAIPGTSLDLVMRSKQAIHILDDSKSAAPTPAATLGGARSYLCVPMLHHGRLIGAVSIYRQEVRPFTDKQIELVQNFAAQAVIAIENTRLLNELRESLQQQTATSEVLSVISSSPGELDPVFKKMLENATRVCNAEFGSMVLQEGGTFRTVIEYNMPPAFVELRRRQPIIPSPPDSPIGRVAVTKQVVHVADVREEPAYVRGAQTMVELADTGGVRTLLIVPMLKEDELIGVIGIYRQEVEPFTDKQIELVSNFAKQAVIAIENTRLLNELRESLQQQTATADVLKVISRSTFDLQTVLDTLVEFSWPTVPGRSSGHQDRKGWPVSSCGILWLLS